MQNLYRRTSGIYAVRLNVPKRFRECFGCREIHISTHAKNLTEAKVSAFAILAQWQKRIVELQSVDVLKISEGSALLTGDGWIRLADVEQELGLTRTALIGELLNIGADFWCHASAWACHLVSNIRDVETDLDGNYILNSALEIGEHQTFVGHVMLSTNQLAADWLLRNGAVEDCLFWLDKRKRSAIFFDLPGQRIDYSDVLVTKPDAERMRVRLAAAIPPETIARAKAPPALAALPSLPISAKPKSIPVSELLDRYLADKARSVKQETLDRNRAMCSRFVELMDDPELAVIDREMVRAYQDNLERLPIDTHRAAQRYGTDDLNKLIDLAAKNRDTLLLPQTVSQYMQKLAEMFNWAVTEDLMVKNPALGLARKLRPKAEKAQDKRDPFDPDDLKRIFGQEWFAKGVGARNAGGRYSHWRPHYYWLPLLGLYTGARLNELAQLYLDDVRTDAHGVPYLDFNLDTPDKFDLDEGDEASEGEKSLKTVNAVRQIPIHPKLIDLGLLEYVEALRAAGHSRLFPELRHDTIKGYGKAAGAWFNERFLGKKLKIERNGRKTFHSFRHSFTTALFRTGASERDISQINGHKRGETESGNRYGKDADVRHMLGIVEKLDYDLPAIGRFQVVSGIKALKDAGLLKSKRRTAPTKTIE